MIPPVIRRPIPIAVLGLAIAALPTGWAPIAAQQSTTAPIVEEGAQVDFGIVVPSGEAGAISITPGGAQLCSPTLTCLGGQREGLIYVTGVKDELVTILIGDALLSNGSATLHARFRPSDPYFILRPGRRQNAFGVTGTLSIEPHQPAGSYSGTYDIIVEYQ